MANIQIIKCDVYNCKHCVASLELCELDGVKISIGDGTDDLEATKCASFESLNF